MTALVWIGVALAALGVAGLAWCIRRAAALRRSEAGREETQAAFQGLIALNLGSVAVAGLGLALMVVGLIL